MIKDSTVFVLGAGASQPFGFPVGTALTQQIIESADTHVGLEFLGFTFAEIAEFRREFQRSMSYSIDAFLQRHDEYMKIGKAAIAISLIPCERDETLFAFPRDRNWYQRLFDRMVLDSTSAESFKRNRVSFVTFNYDRSLEHFLFTAYRHRMKCNAEVAIDAMKQIPIVHVYGALGNYPPLQQGGRPYEPALSPAAIESAVDGIHLMGEGAEAHYLSEARRLLAQANRIVIIGFGFDPYNTELIQLPPFRHGRTDQVPVFASAFGLHGAQREEVRRLLGAINYQSDHTAYGTAIHLELGDRTEDSGSFLAHRVIL